MLWGYFVYTEKLNCQPLTQSGTFDFTNNIYFLSFLKRLMSIWTRNDRKSSGFFLPYLRKQIIEHQRDVKVDLDHTTSKRLHIYIKPGITKLSNIFKCAGYVMGLLRLLRYFKLANPSRHLALLILKTLSYSVSFQKRFMNIRMSNYRFILDL